LQDSNRRKDEFLATLAHELRNPLAPIRTAAELLGRPGLSPEQLAWCSGVIGRQSATMALLLDDLLDVARITSGRLGLKKAYVTPRSVVESAVETVRHLLEEKRHALELLLPEGLPLLEADPLRAAQILTNLLTNAAKYTDSGGRIRVEARAQGACVRFDVTDNGVGIAREAIGSVFEMFRQVKATLHRAEGGLGIGLALSRGLAELHGGHLEAFSAGLGRGSTFSLTLPASDAAARMAVVESSAQSGPGVAAARLRVLVVDDNVDAATSFAMLLDLEGYAVQIAYGGVEALAIAAVQRPDAVFLDVGMPGLNGYEVVARMRAEAWGREIFIVATTGWGQEEDRRRALAEGFDAHLTKPVDPEAAVGLLRRRWPRRARN
jgi:CheY-like chemotaxis protein